MNTVVANANDYETRHRLADAAEEQRRYAGIADAISKHLEELASRTSIVASLRAIKHGHKFGDNRVCKCGVSEREYFGALLEDLPLSVCDENCHEPSLKGHQGDR